MKNLGYYNGEIDEIENIKIPMADRVCFFGDGVYDATYSRNYKIFLIDDHIDRLYSSAEQLEIKVPIEKVELKALLNDLVKKMDTGENFVYFQVSRGNSVVRNHQFPEETIGNLWVNIYRKEIAPIDKKLKLITEEDTRHFHCNIKTLNLIPSVMASQRAKREGADEAVFHRKGRVTECAHSNAHILKGGRLITAPLDNLILPGIARKQLLSACKELKIPLEEKPFNLQDLYSADEIIITSAGQLCLSAVEIDGIKVGGKDNKTLKLLQNYLLNQFLTQTN